VLWVVPLFVLTAGAVLTAATLRKSTLEATALRDECAQLSELRSALLELRLEADTTRSAFVDMRSRSGRSAPDR
jgi:hypothetical protein